MTALEELICTIRNQLLALAELNDKMCKLLELPDYESAGAITKVMNGLSAIILNMYEAEKVDMEELANSLVNNEVGNTQFLEIYHSALRTLDT